MSLSSRSPLFDNRQVCPAIAHEGPWEALNILGRVNQRPTDSDAPQIESVQKVVTLMGMFDTVWIRCPKCGAEVGFQIKAGDCPGNHGYNNNDVPFCPKCLQVRVAELEQENARLRQVIEDIAVPIGDGCGCGLPMCHCFSPESLRIELEERIGLAQETLKEWSTYEI